MPKNEARLSVADVAKLFGVSEESARTYMATGKLAGMKTAKGLRKVWTTTPAAVRAFAAEFDLDLDADLFDRMVQAATERATHGKEKNA